MKTATVWMFWTVSSLLPPAPFPAFATTIVAILGEKSITIASDGIASGESNTTGNPVRTPTCKIRCFDNLCFAAAGRYTATTIGYNLFKLADKELDHSRTLEEVSEHLKAVLTPLLPKIAVVAQKETPDWYAKWLKGSPMLFYLFAGFGANGETLIVTGDARIDAKGRALPIEESVRRGMSGPPAILSVGRNEQILNYLDRHPGWQIAAASDPTDFTERMIRLEILASEREGRRDVGEPISIVRLTSKAPYGVERMGNCQSKEVPSTESKRPDPIKLTSVPGD